MARTKIEVIKGDKAFDLNFTLQDYNGSAVDLTGVSSMKLKMQKPGETALTLNGTMSVVSAEDGTCKYSVAEDDFDEAGVYNAEIEATFSSGQIITFTEIIIKVHDDLPR